MGKKILWIGMLIVSAFALFACRQDIILSIDDLSVTMKEGETYQIDFTSNDSLLIFESNDESIVTVSDSGFVEAVSAGETVIKVTSSKDSSITVDISITVEPNVAIEVEEDALTIYVGDEQAITYTSSYGVTFESSDESIVTVDETGHIEGLSEGETKVTIRSTIDTSVFKEVVITVRKVIDLEVDYDLYELWIGKTESIVYTSNDDVRFEIEDNTIISISPEGIITGLKSGLTTIEIISTYDETVSETISVRVYNDAETLLVTGENKLNVDDKTTLVAEVGPEDAYHYVTWTSSDEEVATVNEEGVLTALTQGTVTVTATSNFDETLVGSISVEVVNYLVVDESKTTSETTTYEDITFEYGTKLFSNIQDAIDVATENATIFVFAGTYNEDLTVDVGNISIEGFTGASIQGNVIIGANGVQLSNLEFTGASTITNLQSIENLVFNNNTVSNVTTATMFMHINGISNLEVKGNVFTNLSGDAIVVENYLSGLVKIYGNIISNANTAIKVIAGDDYATDTKVQVERNTIDQVTIGIEFQTITSIDIIDYARFNSVSNYSNLAAKANANHNVDFTLNYWGKTTPDVVDFEEITIYDLRGFYSDATSIISESKYDPLIPVKIIPESEELLLEVGDIHAIGYEVLPIGSNPDKVRFITSDPDKVQFQSYGVMKGLESGYANITLRLSNDFSINAVMNIELTTDPGIEITPSVNSQNLIVGDALTLETMVFPYQIKDELVIYESLNPGVATINQNGEVTSLSAGTVTFKVKLDSDYNVNTEYTIEFYSSLDENNLLDLLTMNQMSYTIHHEWLQYGVAFNYIESRYDSVSRYLFQDIDVNTSKLLPISSGIRPGILKPDHPEGITTYNSDNVYWVVVHETANTSPGQGALAHANYLWNAAQNGTQLWVSWQYTMDDTYTYQHVPENEIAYHAGDGSSLPGTSTTYLGGGNRNGVGIEMSVANDEDMYLTFQRTAKLSADILVRYNLPRSHIKFHQDFSGKWCPQGMLRGGMVPIFQELADAEYAVRQAQGDRTITFESNHPEYVDQTGRVIKMPDRPMTVSYTITITDNEVSTSRTFFTYLPGTMH
ncbi:MAG: Ig-like domain-containing protein [Tenericutes bacterium]|nr:Ig-like domain-containing protein [Mycoplasmatota bacterium]